MRLLMLATGPFAGPTLRELYHSHHSLEGLFTSPTIERKERYPVSTNSVRDTATEHGTPIFTPEDINSAECQHQLSQFHADLLVVCDYGQILAADTLATGRLGGINLHASLLPKYRGAAPINWAIWNGDAKTGVTVIHMTLKIDAGPCVAQSSMQIGPDETAVELEARLSEMGAKLVRQVLDAMETGPLCVIPQDPTQASKAPRLKKTDGAIDWTRPALAIKNQIRALEPWPKTYTYWHSEKGPSTRLILGKAQVVEQTQSTPPGTVLESEADRLVVAAGCAALRLNTLQAAGKRMMTAEEFLRGHRVKPGERFGPE
jgi:methionyl-tRNA formyltransferase